MNERKDGGKRRIRKGMDRGDSRGADDAMGRRRVRELVLHFLTIMPSSGVLKENNVT